MAFVSDHAEGLLLATNAAIALFGAIILGFGGWLFSYLETHPYGTSGYPTALAITFIVIGIIVTVLGIIGGCIVYNDPSSKQNKFYTFLMLVLVVSQILLVSANYEWKYNAKCDIKYALLKYINTYSDDNLQVWDNDQEKNDCCGGKGPFEETKKNNSRVHWINWNTTYDHDCKNYKEYKEYKKKCKWEKEPCKDEKNCEFHGDYEDKEKCKKEKKIQKNAKASGYRNWEGAVNWQKKLKTRYGTNYPYFQYSVPDSCCKKRTLGCGIIDNRKMKYENQHIWRTDGAEAARTAWIKKKGINKYGCHEKFYKETLNDVGLGHVAGVVIFTLELILTGFATYLLKIIDPPHH